jgi:hypothetical protein
MARRPSRSSVHLRVSIARSFKPLRARTHAGRSSNAMPKEVRAAVAWCLSKDGAGSMTVSEAEAFVEEMFEDGRGGEESW